MTSSEVEMDKTIFSVIAIFKIEVVRAVDALAAERDTVDKESVKWAYLDGKINGLLDAVQLLDKHVLEDKGEKLNQEIL